MLCEDYCLRYIVCVWQGSFKLRSKLFSLIEEAMNGLLIDNNRLNNVLFYRTRQFVIPETKLARNTFEACLGSKSGGGPVW